MVQELSHFLMVINMKAFIKMAIQMERENINGKIKSYSKVNLNKVIDKEKALL